MLLLTRQLDCKTYIKKYLKKHIHTRQPLTPKVEPEPEPTTVFDAPKTTKK